MLPANSIIFSLDERPNTFRRYGKEWALSVRFEDCLSWTIKTWEKKPAPSTVKETKEIIMRSFEFYHRHLCFPPFSIQEVSL